MNGSAQREGRRETERKAERKTDRDIDIAMDRRNELRRRYEIVAIWEENLEINTKSIYTRTRYSTRSC